MTKRNLITPDPQHVFAYDKTKDGWTLIEDCGFVPAITSPSQLELVPFLHEGESYVNGEVMLQRARAELNANLGQKHAEYLLEHQSEIPKEFRKYYLVFTGTIWHYSWHYSDGDDRGFPCLGWRSDKWCLRFSWCKGVSWDGHDRLVHLRG